MGGRLYDPTLRRVLTPDPLSSAPTNAGIHPYAYAMNDPVNLVDPSGYQAEFDLPEVRIVGCDWGDTRSVCQNSRDNPLYRGRVESTGPEPIIEKSSDRDRDAPLPNADAAILGDPGTADPGNSAPGVAAGVSDARQTMPTSQSSAFGALFNVGTAQTGLMLASILVPGPLGAVAGLVSAGLSVYEGNYGEAAVSAGFAVNKF